MNNMAKKSKSLSVNVPGMQGVSVNTYENFGSLTGLFPTITSLEGSMLIQSGSTDIINQTRAIAFDDTIGSTGATAASSTGITVKKRILVPNHQITPTLIGLDEQIDLTTTFTDRDNVKPSGSAVDITTGLQSKYIAGSAFNNIRHNATAVVFSSTPADLVVFSGAKGVDTALKGTFSAGTGDYFAGEVQITDVIDYSANACRGFIDGDTRMFFIASTSVTSSSPTHLESSGSFYAFDIQNSSFKDADQKTLVYAGLTDSGIMSSLPLHQTGAINSDRLLVNERFAAGGFTYEPSQHGPDNKGTDSVAFGGWTK
mgnify:CR=1 FL=1